MESKHKGLPAYSTDLQDEAEYAQALLSSIQQDVATPPPTKKHRCSSPVAAKEDTPTEDSSSDSDTTDNDTLAPLTEEKARTLLFGATSLVAQPTNEAIQHHPASALAPKPEVLACPDRPAGAMSEMIQFASALVTSNIPEDLPPLGENPPAPFPKHVKSRHKDQ